MLAKMVAIVGILALALAVVVGVHLAAGELAQAVHASIKLGGK